MAPDGRSCPNCRSKIEIKAPLSHPADAELERKVNDHYNNLSKITTSTTVEDTSAGNSNTTTTTTTNDPRVARVLHDKEILDRLASNAANALPVFYMSGAEDSPGSTVDLFFFEPRYKILIRRAWEGNQLFICLNKSGGGGPREGDVGLLVHVRVANFTRDGRAQIRGTGTERVTLGDCWQESDTGGLWYSKVDTYIASARARRGSANAFPSPATSTTATIGRNNNRSAAITEVYRRIESAISEGAPAYNQGRIEFCARNYLREALQIVQNEELTNGIGRECTENLNLAVAFAQREIPNGTVNEAAWKLRRAFDSILLRHRNNTTTSRRGNRTGITAKIIGFFRR